MSGTNPEEYKGKSIFQVIIDLFSKIIPVKGSAYDKVLSILDKYADNINLETQTPPRTKTAMT